MPPGSLGGNGAAAWIPMNAMTSAISLVMAGFLYGKRQLLSADHRSGAAGFPYFASMA